MNSLQVKLRSPPLKTLIIYFQVLNQCIQKVLEAQARLHCQQQPLQW